MLSFALSLPILIAIGVFGPTIDMDPERVEPQGRCFDGNVETML